MEFDLWTFILDNLEAAGVIGGYVSISIIGFALITYATQEKFHTSPQLGPKWVQPIIGALLGVIPGCGGTIVASSMYRKQKLSFGGLFAAFITTLGEGSFVLLGASDEADVASNLRAFAIVTAVGLLVGIVVGYLVDAIGIKKSSSAVAGTAEHCDDYSKDSLAAKFTDHIGFYLIIAMAIFLAPGSIMALWGGGIDAIETQTFWVCVVLTVVSIVYYLVHRLVLKADCHDESHTTVRLALLDAVSDIAMVITYVFVGLFVANFIIDILVGPEKFDDWMTSSAAIVVILAAFIGATPGCGGMIAVAVAYITIPHFPMPALIAAAIATSGDGIFPLLAENKKDALLITLVSFVVAVIVGYTTLAIGV